MTGDRNRIPTGDEFDRAVRPPDTRGILRFFKRGKRFQVKQGVGEGKEVLSYKPPSPYPSPVTNSEATSELVGRPEDNLGGDGLPHQNETTRSAYVTRVDLGTTQPKPLPRPTERAPQGDKPAAVAFQAPIAAPGAQPEQQIKKPRPIKISSEVRAKRGEAEDATSHSQTPEWTPSWRPGMSMEEMRKKIGPTQNYLDGN